MAVFLADYAISKNLSASAAVAGVCRDTVNKQRRNDKVFARACAKIRASWFDEMEANGINRATHGVKKPVFQKGYLVGHVQEYPESSMQFFLKANKKKYRKADTAEKVPPTENIVKIVCTGNDGPVV